MVAFDPTAVLLMWIPFWTDCFYKVVCEGQLLMPLSRILMLMYVWVKECGYWRIRNYQHSRACDVNNSLSLGKLYYFYSDSFQHINSTINLAVLMWTRMLYTRWTCVEMIDLAPMLQYPRYIVHDNMFRSQRSKQILVDRCIFSKSLRSLLWVQKGTKDCRKRRINNLQGRIVLR